MKALLAVLLLLPAVAAQADPLPCSEADPCPISLDMTETSLGFGMDSEFTVTAGDWFEFDVFNSDGPDHEISIADLDILFVAPGLDGTGPSSVQGPYLMDAPGSYVVDDLTTGETVTLHVVTEDVAAQGGTPGNDSPGVSAVLLATGLLALLFVRRQRA